MLYVPNPVLRTSVGTALIVVEACRVPYVQLQRVFNDTLSIATRVNGMTHGHCDQHHIGR